MSQLATKIQSHITIDTSGQDNDTIEIRGENGEPTTIRISDLNYKEVDKGVVALPDGTLITNSDVLQLAFQNELIAKTGLCVLEHGYLQAFQDATNLECAEMARTLMRLTKGARN